MIDPRVAASLSLNQPLRLRETRGRLGAPEERLVSPAPFRRVRTGIPPRGFKGDLHDGKKCFGDGGSSADFILLFCSNSPFPVWAPQQFTIADLVVTDINIPPQYSELGLIKASQIILNRTRVLSIYVKTNVCLSVLYTNLHRSINL